MTSARIITADEIRATIGFADLVEPVSHAFQASSAGKAANGLIVMFPAPDPQEGDVYVKTGTLAGQSVYIVKVSPWFRANVDSGQPQGGFIAVCDAQTGHTRALLDDQHYLSDIRTAAAGALAARVLAPPEVTTAAVLGSGVQAFLQPQALFRERPFHRLLVWARDADKAGALCDRLGPALPVVEIVVEPHAEAAVRAADVVITATSARTPILQGDWLRPGQHVTAVGADDPTKCELDAAALTRARVFVDEIATTLANGCIHAAIVSGAYAQDRIAGEIGDVLAGRLPGRQSNRDITVAKFVGLGVQDLVAAEETLRRL